MTHLPIEPPIEPMLAKLAEELPDGRRLVLRAEVGRLSGHRVPRRRTTSTSRAATCGRWTATFPELHEPLIAALPDGCVRRRRDRHRDADGLDFDALQMRLHPAASRVAKLAKETPASFVAFDLLAADGERHLRDAAAANGARALEQLLAQARPPIYLTPMTRDRDAGRGVARALRGRRPRRRHREAAASGRTSRASARC